MEELQRQLADASTQRGRLQTESGEARGSAGHGGASVLPTCLHLTCWLPFGLQGS